MPKFLANTKLVVGVIGVIIVTAIILGITKYKIPAKSTAWLNQSTNHSTNSSNVNTMSEANLPFSAITVADVTDKQVRIATAKGDIVIALDPVAGPLAARNFYYLVQKGYYDGLTFHRVEPGFVIQGGDPLGTGAGGPGYKFADDAVNTPYVTGTVAMANSGRHTNGSQFFICLDNLTAAGALAPNYSIFGQVTSGLDVVKQIVVGDVMTKVTIEPKS